MRRKDEERVAAKLAKAMAMICVRNTMLENIHAGRVPRTKSGDYSDVPLAHRGAGVSGIRRPLAGSDREMG